MIESIQIQNFKSLCVTPRIPLKPVVLLIGPNSSGKSSLFQAILALKQTIMSRDVETPLLLREKYVPLGSFRDMVFAKETSRKMEFALDLGVGRAGRLIRSGRLFPPFVSKQTERAFAEEFGFKLLDAFRMKRIGIQISIGYSPKQEKIFVDRYQLYLYLPKRKKIPIIDVKTRGSTVEISLPLIRLTKNQESILREIFRREKFYFILGPWGYRGAGLLFRSSVRRLLFRMVAEVTRIAPLVLQECMDKLIYLGPLREYPHRVYTSTGETPSDVGLRGELAAQVLSRDIISRRYKLYKKAKEWLSKFNIAIDLDLRTFEKEPGIYQFLMKDPFTGLMVNIADVGFGASQILPLIIEGFYSPPESLMLVEQPEIHLHPRIQAELADLILDIVREGKNIVVETHSEHLMMRFQRRVAEGTLDPENLSIYYFSSSRNGSLVRKIEINRLGQLTNLPEGFFEEDLLESIRILEAGHNNMTNTSR